MTPQNATSWHLITRAAAGNELERSQFAERYSPAIRAYIRARWRDSPLVQESDDAVREVFQVLGKPDGWGKRQLEDWVLTKYHQTSDEYDPSWNVDGAVQDVQLLFMTGILAANADTLPTWTVGDEVEAARKKALRT